MRPAHKFVVSPSSVPAESQPSPAQSLGAEVPLQFNRVPTHAVGVAAERRQCARAFLRLPMRLTRVEGEPESYPVTLVTRDISASGIYFLAPRRIEPGTSIEIEVALVERPMGQGTVRMSTAAHIIRADDAGSPGWHGLAARFDNFEFRRDEALPARFRRR
jgi:c-di-GMP-binding flagellar brake protein YcgR